MMSSSNHLLEAVPFVEFTTQHPGKNFHESFDLNTADISDLDSYCASLIQKVFTLKHSEFCDFIEHHCNLAQDGMQWLCNYDKLLAANAELFQGKAAELRLFKFSSGIDCNRTKLKTHRHTQGLMSLNKRHINAESEERYFSFFETKQNIEKMQSLTAKILFLTSEVLEYQEADVIMHNTKLCRYDDSCKKLIKKIRTLSKLQNEMQPEITQEISAQKQHGEIRLYGPLNIVTNAFKQMMFELKPAGYPYIQGKIADMATFIYDNFTDENGNKFAYDTIRTYLSPNRTDKNPNLENQVKL